MLSVAVLVSGGGTNLQALIDAQKNGQLTGCLLYTSRYQFICNHAARNHQENKYNKYRGQPRYIHARLAPAVITLWFPLPLGKLLSYVRHINKFSFVIFRPQHLCGITITFNIIAQTK